MTYEEFKKLINDNGKYYADKDKGGITIRTAKEYEIAWISNKRTHVLNTNYWTTYEDENFLKENWDIIFDFASTPIKDRRPAKKYYVKLEALRFIDEEKIYLNRYRSVFRATQYEFDTKNKGDESMIDYQTQFTMEEIKEIIPKEDMDKFQFIPVEEEE